MPDQNFHRREARLTLEQVARVTKARIAEGADPSYVLEDVASLESAGARDLSFLDNARYKDQFGKTKAGACFVRPEFADLAPKKLHLLLSDSPYKAYALAAQQFYPERTPAARIADSACIDSTAILGKGCVIEEGAVIKAGARIGEHCWIESGALIGENVVLGDHGRIGPNAVVTHAVIGSHVRLYPGVCIGQDGFGFAPDPQGHIKIPQLGRVIIEDHVEIGAGTCIDRGSGPDTVIGQGSWIDNMVQIGHNVKIGKGCIIAAQCGMAGSTEIGDFVMMGGQVGIGGHLKIGSRARIAAKSGVIGDIPAGGDYAGYPALPRRTFFRHVALLNSLIKKGKSS